VSESTTKERGRRKTLIGIVVSNKMDKTAVVSVERRYPHPLYHKIIKSSKRYKAHDPKNEAVLGDVVRLEETRPLSKEKRWRIAETLTRGNVADIAPREIGVPEEALLEKQAPPAPVAAAPVAEPAAEASAAPAAEAPAAAEAETAPEATDSEVAPKADDNDVIDTPAEAAADEGSMQTESDVLQGAADDMDPADYGKPEEEEKP
jgi:small subunit ribosomal protein S17